MLSQVIELRATAVEPDLFSEVQSNEVVNSLRFLRDAPVPIAPRRLVLPRAVQIPRPRQPHYARCTGPISLAEGHPDTLEQGLMANESPGVW